MSHTGSSTMNAVGRNAVITSLMIECGFIACWTPSTMLLCVYVAGGSVDFGGSLYSFCMALALTNSCINPFIYAAKYREFQQGVRRLKLKLIQQQSQVAAITWHDALVTCCTLVLRSSLRSTEALTHSVHYCTCEANGCTMFHESTTSLTTWEAL